MIIYNVTVNIDDSVHDEWFQFMKSKHIGDVVATGCFSSGQMFKILVEEQEGTSYSIQYRAPNMAAVERYLRDFAPALRKEISDKYGDKFVAFRTLLEEC
jgi:hypothetical protein